MKTAVVITTLNEAETIGPLVSLLVSLDYPVIVVDEDSQDGTDGIALSRGAAVAGVLPGYGIGHCLRRGWQHALDIGSHKVIQMDAGGSHDPIDIERLLAVDAHVAVGSRFVPGSQYHGRPVRRFLSRLAAVACNTVHGTSIKDWTSGYRVFTARAAEKLLTYEYRSKMHGFQVEVLFNALDAGLSIVEVPITYTAGRSSFNRSVALEAFGVWRASHANSPR